MSTSNISQVLDILRSLYRHVQTLDDFVHSVVYREGHRAALVKPSDTHRFQSYVQDILVCFDESLQQVPSCEQICTLPETLAFVLNVLKRKKKRNLLTLGYGLSFKETCNADRFQFQSDAKQSAAYISGSDMWKKIDSRLGTDITRYLLESCSLFVAVPSCAFQVCGVPLYDRVSNTAVCFKFSRHPRPKKRENTNFEKYPCVGMVKRKLEAGAPTIRKKRKRGELVVLLGKRRRADVLKDEEVSAKRPRKNVNFGQKGKQRHRNETAEHQETALYEEPSASKLPAESALVPIEGGPSWRSGIFPPLPHSQCFIRTLGFLYGGKGLGTFILNRKKTDAGSRSRLQGQDLVRIIFFEGAPYLNGLRRKPDRLPKRFFNTVPLFSQLLHQHRRCRYRGILQRMCPLMKERDAGQADLNALLPQHCRPHRVYLFVRECLSSVIPVELWGSDENRIRFLGSVRRFLSSGKFERLSMAEVMWRMKVNDCDWLKLSNAGRVPPSELRYRTRVLGQLLAWLLDGFVVGVVRACFYVTEGFGQKHGLRFYREEVWAKMQDLAFRAHLSRGQMVELTPAEVASLPKETVISGLRFIPKTEGMRPITRATGADAKTRIFKRRCRELRDVLQACASSSPSLLGSTVSGMGDIHKVLRSLAPAQKETPQTLYFVKVDVSGAYDSLPHEKLLEVISQVLSPLQNQLFSIRQYAKIWSDSTIGLRKSFVRQAEFLGENMVATNMKGFVTSLQRNKRAHHAILVEQHSSSSIRGREVLQFFTEMLTGTVVQFGKKIYRQCRGIPQGSVVSALLCCLCYGHMENTLFKNLATNKSCLMRFVDDFLFITPDPEEATGFLEIFLAGVPQYGLAVNPSKVKVNFKVPESVALSSMIHMLPSRCLFPWCGLLLDTYSLDVFKDYSRYAGLSLRYSLTLGSLGPAGQRMRKKLMTILRLKCHPIFVDVKTNSLDAVYKNVYKLVLLHAFRFHVCAQSLPFGQTVAKNPVYFLQMIWDMAQYTNQLIRTTNKGQKLGSACSLRYDTVRLFYSLSFLLVLSQHRRLYKDVIPNLHKWKRCLERRLGDLRLAKVRQAASPRIPVDLRGIQT